jgi:hypothetical protein
MVDQNTAHDSGANSKEVSPILPVNPLYVDEPKVRFMDQRRRLNGMAGMLAAQTSLRDLPQLAVHRLNDPAVCVPVARSPSMKKPGYFG